MASNDNPSGTPADSSEREPRAAALRARQMIHRVASGANTDSPAMDRQRLPAEGTGDVEGGEEGNARAGHRRGQRTPVRHRPVSPIWREPHRAPGAPTGPGTGVRAHAPPAAQDHPPAEESESRGEPPAPTRSAGRPSATTSHHAQDGDDDLEADRAEAPHEDLGRAAVRATWEGDGPGIPDRGRRDNPPWVQRTPPNPSRTARRGQGAHPTPIPTPPVRGETKREEGTVSASDMFSALMDIRREVASLSSLRHDVASMREEMASVTAMRAEVASVTAMRAEVASVTAMRDEMASWMDATRREVSSLAEQVSRSIGAGSPGRESVREPAPSAMSTTGPLTLHQRARSASQAVPSQVGPPVRVAATRVGTEPGGDTVSRTATSVVRRRITMAHRLQWPVWRDNGTPWEKLAFINNCEAIGKNCGWDSYELYGQFYLANTTFALRLAALDHDVELQTWEQARERILMLMGRGLPDFLRRGLLHPRGRPQETACQFFQRIYGRYLNAGKFIDHLPTEHAVIEACMDADSFTGAMWGAMQSLPRPYIFKRVIAHFRDAPDERRRTLIGDRGSKPAVAVAASTPSQGSRQTRKHGSGPKRKRCYKCGRDNHFTRECPERERCCFHCHKPGHIAASCPDKQRRGNGGAAKADASPGPSEDTGGGAVVNGAVVARALTISDGVSVVCTSTPERTVAWGPGGETITASAPWCVVVTVDGEPLKAMLDSGAAVSMLAAVFGRRHSFDLQPPLEVRGVSGVERVHARGAKVPVRLSSTKTVTHSFVLADEELPYAVDMLIGQDLISRAGITLMSDGVLLDDERMPLVGIHERVGPTMQCVAAVQAMFELSEPVVQAVADVRCSPTGGAAPSEVVGVRCSPTGVAAASRVTGVRRSPTGETATLRVAGGCCPPTGGAAPPDMPAVGDVDGMLAGFEQAFAQFPGDIGRCSSVKCRINTGDAKPIRCPQYSSSPPLDRVIMAHVDKWRLAGVVKPVESPWSSPILIVPKKVVGGGSGQSRAAIKAMLLTDDVLAADRDRRRRVDACLAMEHGAARTACVRQLLKELDEVTSGTRACVDLRRLNAVTVDEVEGFPVSDLSAVRANIPHDPRLISALDLVSAFHNVEMEPESVAKTAFRAGGRMYAFTRMCFGLRAAMAYMAILAQHMLGDLVGPAVNYYVDDIAIFTGHQTGDTKTTVWQRHVTSVRQVLDRVISAGVKLHRGKSSFAKPEMEWVSWHISAAGIGKKLSAPRLRAWKEYPAPTNKAALVRFTALARYYGEFVDGLADLAEPLVALQRAKAVWVWGAAQQRAFDAIKAAVLKDVRLAAFRFDRPFELMMDASNVALGGQLMQRDNEGRARTLAFLSRALTKTERNYCATERELLALTFGVQRCARWIAFSPVVVYTDHQALQYLFKKCGKPGRLGSKLVRWVLSLMGFNIEVRYKRGQEMDTCGPDALSRVELPAPLTQLVDHYRLLDMPRDPATVEDLVVTSQTTRDAEGGGVGVGVGAGVGAHASDADVGAGVGAHTSVMTAAVLAATTNANVSFPSDEEIMEAQQRDAACVDIMDKLRTEHEVPVPGRCRLHFRCLLDGMLVAVNTESGAVLPVIAGEQRRAIMAAVHQRRGHPGVERTMAQLRNVVFWSGMVRDVREYVARCVACQKHKAGKAPKLGKYQTFLANAPDKVVCVDLVGPLPETEHTPPLRYVLTMQCKFSRLVKAVPLADITAHTVAKAFVETWVYNHGVPDKVHSDQGSQFMSAVLRQVMKILGSKQSRTSAYHPQGNSIERWHRLLGETLRIMTDEANDPAAWSSMVPEIVYWYNTTVSTALGFTPHEVYFGRAPNSPFESIREGANAAVAPGEYVRGLKCRLNDVWAAARRVQEKRAASNQRLYNVRRETDLFEVGEKVLLSEGAKAHKLAPRRGLCEVVRRIRPYLYEVKRLDAAGRRKVKMIVNISRLRRLKRMEVEGDLPRQQGSVQDRVTAERRNDNTTPNGQSQPDQSDQLGLEDSAGAAAAPAGAEAAAAADDETKGHDGDGGPSAGWILSRRGSPDGGWEYEVFLPSIQGRIWMDEATVGQKLIQAFGRARRSRTFNRQVMATRAKWKLIS